MEQGNLSSARDILQRGVLAVRGKHEAAVPLWTAWGLLEERSGTMSHCMLHNKPCLPHARPTS